MMQGFASPWPEFINDLLAKRENNLDDTALTDYFRLLDEYLDNQLDPTSDTSIDDYVEPPIEVEIDNEIPEEPIKEKETHENIQENIIDTEEDKHLKDENKKDDNDESVGVLEIKNPVAIDNEKENPKEASYNMYWWIGVAVALAVVVILVAIIARKRQQHRKQLERQRRQNCA